MVTSITSSLTRSGIVLFWLLTGFVRPPEAVAGSPAGLETIYSEGQVQVFCQPGRKDVQKLGPRGGRKAIARGDLVATSKSSRVAVGIGGHTVVKASQETVFSILPPSLEGGKSKRRVEVIFVFLGEVKVTTNWKMAPKGLRVKVSSEARAYSTDLGAVILRVAPPPLPETAEAPEGNPAVRMDPAKALPLSAAAIPFTEKLFAPNPPPERVAELKAVRGAPRVLPGDGKTRPRPRVTRDE